MPSPLCPTNWVLNRSGNFVVCCWCGGCFTFALVTRRCNSKFRIPRTQTRKNIVFASPLSHRCSQRHVSCHCHYKSDKIRGKRSHIPHVSTELFMAFFKKRLRAYVELRRIYLLPKSKRTVLPLSPLTISIIMGMALCFSSHCKIHSVHGPELNAIQSQSSAQSSSFTAIS